MTSTIDPIWWDLTSRSSQARIRLLPTLHDETRYSMLLAIHRLKLLDGGMILEPCSLGHPPCKICQKLASLQSTANWAIIDSMKAISLQVANIVVIDDSATPSNNHQVRLWAHSGGVIAAALTNGRLAANENSAYDAGPAVVVNHDLVLGGQLHPWYPSYQHQQFQLDVTEFSDAEHEHIMKQRWPLNDFWKRWARSPSQIEHMLTMLALMWS